MISLFHVFTCVCSAVGLVLGAAVGHAYFGWWGILFGFPGAYIGLVLGRLLRIVAAIISRRIERADSANKK
jgi:hypothetical protein